MHVRRLVEVQHGVGQLLRAVRAEHGVREPVELLRQILRVAKRVVITFPNFGHWTVLAGLLLRKRMPKSDELPYEWYNTPNIHLFTIRDFTALCKEEDLKIERRVIMNDKLSSKILTGIGFETLGAERVIAVVSKNS